jgi:type II secretory pathway pseudopilin PulG
MIPALSTCKRTGFTLIEALVATALVTVAIAGPFSSSVRSYLAAVDSKNRLMASYLAQEGIEYVRMLRDNTYLADYQNNVADLSSTAFYDDFTNGVSGVDTSIYGCEGNPYNAISNPGGSPGGDGTVACALDPSFAIGIGSGKALQVCPSVNSCPTLYLSGGQYTLTASGAPLFTRSLRFYSFGPEVEVVSTVSWTYHGVTNSIVLTDYLSPWQ